MSPANVLNKTPSPYVALTCLYGMCLLRTLVSKLYSKPATQLYTYWAQLKYPRLGERRGFMPFQMSLSVSIEMLTDNQWK